MQTYIASTDHRAYTLGFLLDYEDSVVLPAGLFKLCTDSSCENPWEGGEIAEISNMLIVANDSDYVRQGGSRVSLSTLGRAIRAVAESPC